MSVIETLPIELWEEVVYCIPSPRDLLSLALVSKLFSSFIIPYHLPYRHIRCGGQGTKFWEQLAASPRCARGIRSLVSLDERYSLPDHGYSPKWSSILAKREDDVTPFDLIVMPALLKSLWHMTALERFGFSWGFESRRKGFSNVLDISRVLADRAICLRSLTVDFMFLLRQNSQHEIKDFLNSLPVWQLSNLTQVRLSHMCESAERMLIAACPNLEDLCLSLHDIRAYSCPLLFHQANWKKFRRLSLLGARAQPIPSDFFQRHPSLECLLMDASCSLPSLLDASLPMLRSFSWDAHLADPTLSSYLPKSALSGLVHCRVAVRMFDFAARMDNLESLQLVLASDESLLRSFSPINVPKLQKLQVIGRTSGLSLVALPVLSIPRLTHLYLAFDPKEILQEFSEIETLRYIQGLKDSIEIDRDSSGNYVGYHVVPESHLGERPYGWGNFF